MQFAAYNDQQGRMNELLGHSTERPLTNQEQHSAEVGFEP